MADKKKEKVKRYYPYPEVLPGDKGKGWTIRDGDPRTNRKHHIMDVPLADGVIPENIRTLQVAREKWTPGSTSVPGVGQDLVDATETMRIVQMVDRVAGIDDVRAGIKDPSLQQSIFRNAIAEGNLRSVVVEGLPHVGTQVYAQFLKDLERDKTGIGEKAAQLLSQAKDVMESIETPSWADTTRLSNWLDQEINQLMAPPEADEKFEPPKDKPKEAASTPGEVAHLNEETAELLEEALEKGMEDMMDSLKASEVEALKAGKEIEVTKEKLPWGQLFYDTVGLPRRIKPKMIGRKSKAMSEGIVVRDVSRWFGDFKIFGVITRQMGGALLLDCSGSMSLSDKRIQEIVQSAPAVTVALYSGSDSTGQLRVVVKNGRMCDESKLKSPGGSGNIVDGPCIEDWLIKQGEPRIWVSDGEVTGVGDRQAMGLKKFCAALCLKHRVIRVENIYEARVLFKRLELAGGLIHPAMRRQFEREIAEAARRY